MESRQITIRRATTPERVLFPDGVAVLIIEGEQGETVFGITQYQLQRMAREVVRLALISEQEETVVSS